MSWYKTLGKCMTIALMACSFSCVAATIVVANKANKLIQPFVESNLARMMHAQERKLGIKHIGTPKIKYDTLPGFEGLSGAILAGAYMPEKDTIYLPPGSTITPENCLENKLMTILKNGIIGDVKEVLDHEIGHFYMDKLHESLGKGNWPSEGGGIGQRLIAEGIAEYFTRTMNYDTSDPFSDADWPKSTAAWSLHIFSNPRFLYNGGYHLVKQIIGKHGKRGIEHLICNPPNADDLTNILAYQQKILQELSQGK